MVAVFYLFTLYFDAFPLFVELCFDIGSTYNSRDKHIHFSEMGGDEESLMGKENSKSGDAGSR